MMKKIFLIKKMIWASGILGLLCGAATIALAPYVHQEANIFIGATLFTLMVYSAFATIFFIAASLVLFFFRLIYKAERIIIFPTGGMEKRFLGLV